MTRYILFNGAPTTTECIESSKPDYQASRWTTNVVEFSSKNDSTRPLPLDQASRDVWNTSGSQFEDAETQIEGFVTRGKVRREEETRVEVEARLKRPRTSYELTGVGGDSMCQSFLMLPPPSQPRPGQSQGTFQRKITSKGVPQSQRQDVSRVSAANETTRNVDSFASRARAFEHDDGDDTTFSRHYNLTSILEAASSSPPPPEAPSRDVSADQDYPTFSSSQDLSMGPPPALPWAIHDLTKLDHLRLRYNHHSLNPNNPPDSSITVSVLAIVSSFDRKETGNGNLTEIVLEDETGGNTKLIGWGRQGEELSESLRVGDVVYFGKVKLVKSRYNQSLELRLIDGTSQVGIAFRTRIFDESFDELYRFDPVWAKELEQARAVMDIVEWWTKNRE